MSVSWGTEKRYLVQERSKQSAFWATVERTECLIGTFCLIRDQKALMAKGKRKFPNRQQDYERHYRVYDARVNKEVIWPAHDFTMLPKPSIPGPEGLDHMEDALRYVTQGIAATNMLRA